MTHEEGQEALRVAADRDPRNGPFGCFSGSSFHMDSYRTFEWFETEQALYEQIMFIHPKVYEDIGDNERLLCANKLRDVLEVSNNLSVEKLVKVNEISKAYCCIEWWGTFEELKNGESDFAKNIRSMMRDNESESPIAESEIDEFVEHLEQCGL